MVDLPAMMTSAFVFDMELIQSFIYSIQRVKLSLYEQRMLLKVVEYAQSRVAGLLVKNDLTKWQHDFDNVKMEIPIKDILSDGSQHYDQVRKAATMLMTRKFEYLDSESGTWIATPLIYNCSHTANSGIIKFYVSRTLFDVLLDFSKGFRQYSLQVALSLSSPYASRLYVLMSGQSSPIQFKIDELKRMFGVVDKYTQTADFIKKIIVPSQKILDAKGCTSFTFARVKDGQKVTALLFYPVKRDEPTASQKAAKISTSLYLTAELRIMLINISGFTLKELGAHKVMLEEFAKINEAYAVLLDITNRAITQRKNKGWIISAMRSEIQQHKSKISAVTQQQSGK